MLSTRDIETLGRLTDIDTYRKWEGMAKKLDYGGKITIANTGLYSSGKSSLFNALLGRVSDDNLRFPVGAVPTTKAGDRETLTENIELIDTPGIDANAADDDTAFNMLMQSDVILMTHNVKRGMLDRPEYEWLKRIAGAMNPESIPERLIFVSTWTDGIDNEADRQKLRDEIHRQVTEAVNGAAVQFAEVSAKKYKTGVERDKAALRDTSGIPALKELVISAGKNYVQKAAALRRQELLTLCAETRDRLSGRRREVSSEIDSKKSRIRSRYDGAFEKWRGILGSFTRMKSGVMSQLQKIYDASDSASDYQGFKNKIYSM